MAHSSSHEDPFDLGLSFFVVIIFVITIIVIVATVLIDNVHHENAKEDEKKKKKRNWDGRKVERKWKREMSSGVVDG